MSAKKRTLKVEKLARIFDAEIQPVWAGPFGRMLLRGLQLPEKGQVLDVACGTGATSVELLRRMTEDTRLIAIDDASAMLDVARKKIAELGRKGVFFRTESAEPKLSFADDVYDAVVCNLGVAEMADMPAAIADFARVTRQGGQVRITMPLAGTFAEFYDIFSEVLVKHDKHEGLERLAAHMAKYPTAEACEEWMADAGLQGTVEIETFSMLFKSSREFFFAPVIEYGPLPAWKAIAGSGQELQDVFWYIKEAIDAYFGGRAFEVTVVAGCICGTKAEPDTGEVFTLTPKVQPVETPSPVADVARLADEASDDFDEDDMVTHDVDPVELGTSEIDLLQIEEIDTGSTSASAEDVELDAFVEGRERPAHLDSTLDSEELPPDLTPDLPPDLPPDLSEE